MHSNTYMSCTFVVAYKRKTFRGPLSVLVALLSMKVVLTLCLTLPIIVSDDQIPYKIPYNYYNIWMVVGQNSSGQLFFDPDPYSRRIFVWKPYNASILPSLFFEDYPKIIQDSVSTTPSGTSEGTLSEDIHVTPQPAVKEIEETIPSKHRSGIDSANASALAALELPPPSNKSTNDSPTALGMNVLHHSLKLAELMATLSKQRSIPDLAPPSTRNGTFNSTFPNNDSIVSAEDEVELTKESSRLYHM